MSSYFILELDTTPPILEIIMPNYTIRFLETDIILSTNEDAMEFQDIYFIDSSGKKHSATFFQDNDVFTYKTNFSGFSIGIATLYCRLKDSVGNLSQEYSKTINVLKGNYSKTVVTEKIPKQTNALKISNIELSHNKNKTHVQENVHSPTINAKINNLEIMVVKI